MTSGDRSDGAIAAQGSQDSWGGHGTLLLNPAETVNAHTGEELDPPSAALSWVRPMGFWSSFCLHSCVIRGGLS